MPIVNAANEAGKKIVENLGLADSPIYITALASCYSLTTLCDSMIEGKFFILSGLVLFVLLSTVMVTLRSGADSSSKSTVQVVRGSAIAATVLILSQNADGTQHQFVAFWASIGIAIVNGLLFLSVTPGRVLRSRFSGRYVTLTLLASLTLYTATYCASQFAYHHRILQLDEQRISGEVRLQDIYSIKAKMEPTFSVKGAMYSVSAADTTPRETYKLLSGVAEARSNYCLTAIAVAFCWLLVALGILRMAMAQNRNT